MIQPIVISENPNASRKAGTAEEITTRSMYVIMYAATVSQRTTCRTRVGRCAVNAELPRLSGARCSYNRSLLVGTMVRVHGIGERGMYMEVHRLRRLHPR